MRATPVTGLFLFVVIILAVQASLASTEEGWWLELKYSSSRAGYDPRVWDWSGRTYYDFIMEPVFTAGLCIASSPVIADVDGDGVDDVLVATADTLYAISVAKDYIVWSVGISGDSYSSPSVGDVDGDGVPEVVLATSGGLYVVSLEGVVEAFYPGINADFGSVIISDIDGDGDNELIVALYEGRVEIVDLTGGDYMLGILYVGITGGPLMAPAAIGDVDGDGVPEVVIGSRDFRLYVIDGVPYMSSTTPSSTTTESTTPATPSTTPPANSPINPNQ